MDSLLYVPGRGILYRLDPRTKLLWVLSVSIYALIEQSTAVLLLILLALHLLIWPTPTVRARFGSLYRTLAPLLSLLLVLGCLRWQAADALIAVGPVGVTLPAIWRALGLAARIAALTLTLSLFLWSTTPGDAIAGLTRLGIPFTLSLAAVMAMQQIVIFKMLFVQILEAQQSRGLVIDRRNPLRVARAYIPVIVPLLINAFRQADELALALQMRGLGARRTRSSRRRLHMTARDWLFISATGAVLCLLACS